MKRLEEIARQGRIDDNAGLTDRQPVIINKSAEEVWEKLIDISAWPTWNPLIEDVTGDTTEAGDTFSWKYHGKKISSKLVLMDPNRGLAFTGKSGFAKSIYLFTLDKTEETQTIVTFQQSVEGFLSILFMNHGGLHHSLLDWLDTLKKALEADQPLFSSSN